jgi:hypothetical protein
MKRTWTDGIVVIGVLMLLYRISPDPDIIIIIAKPTQCLDLHTVGSPWVKAHFQETKMQGSWYDIAVKKDTQPRFCHCQTSHKTMSADGRAIHDRFGAYCLGLSLSGTLVYSFSDTPGIWNVTSDFFHLRNRIFPSAVVDVGVHPTTGEYEWMIEYCCIQWTPDTLFSAINMYSRTYTDQHLSVMDAAARKYGLGPYMDEGIGLHYPDHTRCRHSVDALVST